VLNQELHPKVGDVDMVQQSILSCHQPGGSHVKDSGTELSCLKAATLQISNEAKRTGDWE